MGGVWVGPGRIALSGRVCLPDCLIARDVMVNASRMVEGHVGRSVRK